jgi:hypothetical protein
VDSKREPFNLYYKKDTKISPRESIEARTIKLMLWGGVIDGDDANVFERSTFSRASLCFSHSEGFEYSRKCS